MKKKPTPDNQEQALIDCPICGHDSCPLRQCKTKFGPARFTVYCVTCKSRAFISEDSYKELDQGKKIYTI